jgi:hypothetical protein
MANGNVGMHLSEAELWRSVNIVKQGTRHREVSEVFGVDHTVITQAWARFHSMVRLYHTTWWRQKKSDCWSWGSFLVIQTLRHRFAAAASGVRVSTQTIRIRLLQVVCDREDHVYGSRCLETTAGSDMIGPWTMLVGAGWTDGLSYSPTSLETA